MVEPSIGVPTQKLPTPSNLAPPNAQHGVANATRNMHLILSATPIDLCCKKPPPARSRFALYQAAYPKSRSHQHQSCPAALTCVSTTAILTVLKLQQVHHYYYYYCYYYYYYHHHHHYYYYYYYDYCYYYYSIMSAWSLYCLC